MLYKGISCCDQARRFCFKVGSLCFSIPLCRSFNLTCVSATGEVSLCGMVLAKAAGAATVITLSSDDKLQLVKEKYGVEHIINCKIHPNWAQEALKLTGLISFLRSEGLARSNKASSVSLKVALLPLSASCPMPLRKKCQTWRSRRCYKVVLSVVSSWFEADNGRACRICCCEEDSNACSPGLSFQR